MKAIVGTYFRLPMSKCHEKKSTPGFLIHGRKMWVFLWFPDDSWLSQLLELMFHSWKPFVSCQFILKLHGFPKKPLQLSHNNFSLTLRHRRRSIMRVKRHCVESGHTWPWWKNRRARGWENWETWGQFMWLKKKTKYFSWGHGCYGFAGKNSQVLRVW